LAVTVLKVEEVTAPTDRPSAFTSLIAYPLFGLMVKV